MAGDVECIFGYWKSSDVNIGRNGSAQRRKNLTGGQFWCEERSERVPGRRHRKIMLSMLFE